LGKSQIKNAKFYRNVKTGWGKRDEKTLALLAKLGHTFNAQILKDSKL
jgi:hypothetical protein